MEFRNLGNTGLRVGALGMGTEYLIDRPKQRVLDMVARAVEAGINYFDVFWAKPEFRDVMGEAFEPYRRRVMLAAHLGSTHIDGQYRVVRDQERAGEFFEDFLTRYHTDYADVLFLHNSDTQDDYDRVMEAGGLGDLAVEYKRQGKAKAIGFSGHTVSTSLQAVKSGIVEVLMYPVNPTGNAVAGRQELFAECVRRGIGIVAMKPFAGGKLLTPRDTETMDIVHTGTEKGAVNAAVVLTPLQGLSYALSRVGVSTVVPGCENMDELETDISFLSAKEDAKDFSGVIDAIGRYAEGECVYCNHCLPCPSAIDIGLVLRLFESATRYGSEREAREAYGRLSVGADACTECGACDRRCPFGVATSSLIQEAAGYFA